MYLTYYRGGVYTPGAAFSKTTFLEKLQREYTFKIIEMP